MLNNPFDQLFSYEYAVTGSWDDPVVVRTNASRSGGRAVGPRRSAERLVDRQTR